MGILPMPEWMVFRMGKMPMPPQWSLFVDLQ
jgi:hypothetical protein